MSQNRPCRAADTYKLTVGASGALTAQEPQIAWPARDDMNPEISARLYRSARTVQ